MIIFLFIYTQNGKKERKKIINWKIFQLFIKMKNYFFNNNLFKLHKNIFISKDS